MKIVIDPNNWDSANAAANGIVSEMRSRRKGRRGYAVVFDDGIEFFHRATKGLDDAVWDLSAWARNHGKELTIFENVLHDVAVRLKEE